MPRLRKRRRKEVKVKIEPAATAGAGAGAGSAGAGSGSGGSGEPERKRRRTNDGMVKREVKRRVKKEVKQEPGLGKSDGEEEEEEEEDEEEEEEEEEEEMMFDFGRKRRRERGKEGAARKKVGPVRRSKGGKNEVLGHSAHIDDAKAFIHGVGLKSKKAFHKWRKTAARPVEIPSTPHKTYKDCSTFFERNWAHRVVPVDGLTGHAHLSLRVDVS